MADDHRIDHPRPDEGARLWVLAGESGGLDRNTPYAYMLWCRDFAATTVVARFAPADAASDADLAGFITGYRRPDAPGTLFVWQVAVHPSARRQGLAGRMLDALADAQGPAVDHLEATVTPSNTASASMFAAFARRRDVALIEHPLFEASDFPTPPQDEAAPDHEAEVLLRIGPW